MNYLCSGHRFASRMGYSFCRFACDAPPALMGDSDLTDGEWVWPEGLAHYVDAHSVLLPDEFVEGMRRNGWVVPASATDTRSDPISAERNFDFTFWVGWSRRNARRPWYWPW